MSSPIIILARKEFSDGLRNKWVAGATLVLALFGLALTLLGSTPTGVLGVKPLAVTVVSLSSLTIYLIPLIALLLGYDAIVGEAERGCLILMLTYPVSRVEIVLGKFLGHAAILTFATVVGYGVAGAAAAWASGGDAESWRAFVWLLVSTIMLGLAFLALAYLISALVKERSTAAGLAVGIWLLLRHHLRPRAYGEPRREPGPHRGRRAWPLCCCLIPPTSTDCSTSRPSRMCALCPAWPGFRPPHASRRSC